MYASCRAAREAQLIRWREFDFDNGGGNDSTNNRRNKIPPSGNILSYNGVIL
jgi:hypothetical protein